MVHSRSLSWLIPTASHDSFSTDVHHHGSLTTAARGGQQHPHADIDGRTFISANSMVTVDRSVSYIRTITTSFRTHQRPRGDHHRLVQDRVRTRGSPFRRGPLVTLADLHEATSAWVHWYSNDRLMHRLGQRPPAEADYYATTDPANRATHTN
jgi:hypothetical protein